MVTDFKLFTIEGSGEFPYDMLRYDMCWPCDGKDASQLAGRVHGERSVRLETLKSTRLTPDRWLSFGWKIV